MVIWVASQHTTKSAEAVTNHSMLSSAEMRSDEVRLLMSDENSPLSGTAANTVQCKLLRSAWNELQSTMTITNANGDYLQTPDISIGLTLNTGNSQDFRTKKD